MTPTVLAISARLCRARLCLLLTIAPGPPVCSWWVKAAAIVVTSAFFVEAFLPPPKGLLGLAADRPAAGPFPIAVGAGGRARSQELQSRRDLSLDRGGGREQRSRRRAALVSAALFRARLADKSAKARSEIMSGKPQQGSAEDLGGAEKTARGQVRSGAIRCPRPSRA